jgi:hypothetical protein
VRDLEALKEELVRRCEAIKDEREAVVARLEADSRALRDQVPPLLDVSEQRSRLPLSLSRSLALSRALPSSATQCDIGGKGVISV